MFTVTPDDDPAPVLGVTFDTSLTDAPYQYITQLIATLNGDPGLTTPSRAAKQSLTPYAGSRCCGRLVCGMPSSA